MKLIFEPERNTKNTIRFKEVESGIVGTIYIKKDTLQKLGYQQNTKIEIEFNISGGKNNG